MDTTINYNYIPNETNKRILEHTNKLHTANQNNKIEQVAKEFEMVFLAALIKPVVEQAKDPFLGDSSAGKIYQDLLVDKYSEIIAESTPLGIKEKVEDLLKLQEAYTHE
ncbi:Rod binding protein [Rickettsiales bacterium Ac37b]|nr:Rod binding protein [Rickettsiales bacterium Ac37b]